MQIQSVSDILSPTQENQEIPSVADGGLDFSEHLEAFDSDDTIEADAVETAATEPEESIETDEQPMLDFLQQMSSKLNVKPEKVVEAFAQLSAEDLAKPPEQNISKLVEGLKLPPAQIETARSLFKDLLQKIEPTENEAPEKISDTLTALQAMPYLSTPAVLPQAIDQAAVASEPLAANEPVAVPESLELKEFSEPLAQNEVTEQPEQDAAPAQFEIPKELKLVEPQVIAAYQMPAPVQKDMAKESNASEPTEIAPLTLVEAPVVQAEAKQEFDGEEDLSQDDEILTSDKFLVSEGTKTQTTKSFSEVLKTGAPQAEKNIDEIIQQSQILIKKGGGEMKVQLQPEGLGQVQLKISVQDGQVQVEMLTDSNDAKKAIEHSLQDLKVGLSSHQLEVASIRVDVTRDSSFNFDQQQQQPPPQRQMAENFNQNLNQNQRQEFGESQQRGYSPKVAAGLSSQNNNSTIASRRLNLVA